MDSPLHLNIRLTPPPQPPVPDDTLLATIALQYDELTCAGGTLTTDATLSPKEAANLHWYLEEY